jgi:hypothetical protein
VLFWSVFLFVGVVKDRVWVESWFQSFQGRPRDRMRYPLSVIRWNLLTSEFGSTSELIGSDSDVPNNLDGVSQFRSVSQSVQASRSVKEGGNTGERRHKGGPITHETKRL